MRHALLALALERGRPYRSLELTTRKDNAPSPSLVVELTERPLEEVRRWLAAPAAPELLEAAQAAKEEHLAAKRERANPFVEALQRARAIA